MLFSRFKLLLLLCLGMCLLVSACTSIPASVSSAVRAGKTVVAVPTLRELAQERHFLVGTAVNVDALQSDASYATVLGREFNMVTPENAMKFDATNPRQGVFTFQQGDTLIA